ncbi:MAG TPA: hypothetical protein VD710_07880 [Nitrososphaeraceae archaeon]|nr:hypothetical protein [Nitrososphaeraceae archaeon]
MKPKNVLITLSILLFLATVITPIAYAIDVFHKDETPFGKPYEDWIQDWWRWNAAIPGDPVTTFAGVKEDGCLINKEGPVAFLMDPAIGGVHHQRCEISSNQAILFPAWSAVCTGAVKGNENKSFQELSECAKGYDLGKVTVNAWVDNKSIAHVKAEDLKTTNLINATELNTKRFNITIPENSNLAVDYPGTHLGATHGWYIFLKPLPAGEHTIHYINDVRETTLGAGNTNNADITYSLKVK